MKLDRWWTASLLGGAALLWQSGVFHAQTLDPVEVEGQPLAGNVTRLLQTLEFLGHPMPDKQADELLAACKAQDAVKIQKLLDPHALFLVHVNPEARVKVKRGPAPTTLQQGGYTPVIIKITNDSGVTKTLNMTSPQARPIYGGGGATRVVGKVKEKITPADIKERFLEIELYNKAPLTDKLSGLKAEYALALLHSSQAGKREAMFAFDIGQGTQDLGFRAEIPVLFNIRPAVPVKLIVNDFDGKPTTGRFTFRDQAGKVYPSKAKRLAPDFFFQDQVYRHSGGVVLLPPGELTMTYGRGPEYQQLQKKIRVPDKGDFTVEVKLERWVNPMDYGLYSGDHHIHAAGCAHYENPTEGVFADDMFLHVKGEGLNVGCNLTWGPCYDFQRQFFTPEAHKVSEPLTVLKYDVEVSGFGSQALGHVCLLNLRDQTYPGSDGTKTKGWPTWTTPLMRWAKAQGAFTGYAHSASGLGINPKAAAQRNLALLDANKDGKLSQEEASKGLLPDAFQAIDANNDGSLTVAELVAANARLANVLPNLVVPEMNGIGAQEICVTSAQGVCDFISAMDTARVPEWNCWYHIMNCGFPLKASGETDFPCISGSRVGEGRVYVQLGKVDRIDFPVWAKGLAEGRSYVSDGYAHALKFEVNGKPAGDKVQLDKPGNVTVKARLAFASATPLGTAKGGQVPQGPSRNVEIIVNGEAVQTIELPADDKAHDVELRIPIQRSSWVAIRQFPQMHTNPVDVIVDGAPIRASRKSALWCIGTIEQLWRERGDPIKMPLTPIDARFGPKSPDMKSPRRPAIIPEELQEAHRTFQWAIERYRKLAAECPEGS
ncbi:MAG: CehA/McbA family metallohydrolase [Gemmataceae bacterium]|nr:CehA/McbA family metallohydrolase [Gemmataceae bacterium]